MTGIEKGDTKPDVKVERFPIDSIAAEEIKRA